METIDLDKYTYEDCFKPIRIPNPLKKILRVWGLGIQLFWIRYMGDNATKRWEWHNVEVGEGYQAKGVVRQPGVSNNVLNNVVDMRKSVDSSLETKSRNDFHDTKEKAKKKRKHDDSCEGSILNTKSKSKFNPLLQLLAKNLSNQTTEFS